MEALKYLSLISQVGFTMDIFGYETGGKISLSVYADIYAFRGYKRMYVGV